MKSSIKRIAAVATFVMTTAVALADAPDSYLYWMVSPDAYNYLDSTKTPVEYDYAMVSVDGGNYLNWYNQGETTQVDNQMPYNIDGGGGTPAVYWGLVGTTLDSSTTFLFELYNNNELIGWYTTQVGAQSIVSGTNPSGASAYTLTGVVPEPTSGLLSLFGLAALALRRRKRA